MVVRLDNATFVQVPLLCFLLFWGPLRHSFYSCRNPQHGFTTLTEPIYNTLSTPI